MKHRSSITKTAFMKNPISSMGPPDPSSATPWMLNPGGMTDNDELRGLREISMWTFVAHLAAFQNGTLPNRANNR